MTSVWPVLKILHIITSLDQGGAEGVLTRLVLAKETGVEHEVISLKGEGFYGKQLLAAGVTLHYFDFGRFFQLRSFSELFRLVRVIASLSPDVVQTWLYHADLIGCVAARMAGCRRVVWGIRTGTLSPLLISRFTMLVAWLCARLSSVVPSAIVTCSVQAASEHKRMGYEASKFEVIPNGFDLDVYRADPAGRQETRRAWGVGPNDVLLGCVARWDRYKDHPNLLEALSIVISKGVTVRCVLVGGGLSASNGTLLKLLAKYNLQSSVILAGSRSDIPSVMNALDLHVLPSVSEAFPNVVAEAMACGVPAIVTDVGDAALIVGTTGWVVPPQNPEKLAYAVLEAVAAIGSQTHADRRISARKRIEQNFGLNQMTRSYVNLWKAVGSK